jgi:hypothetical protein
MTHAMARAGTTSEELEISAEGLALAVDQVAELAARAEGGFSVAEGFFMALAHAWVGFAEADNAETLRMVGGSGAKGMSGG